MKQIEEVHNFVGMAKDLSQSKTPATVLYDARNIRVDTNKNEQMLSITNEQGTLDLNIEIEGMYLGHAILNNYLVIFSTKSNIGGKDYITRIDISNPSLNKILFEGYLNFNINKSIETLVSFENEDIQKVYWVDGVNQPRIINIAPKEDYRISTYTSDSFNFVRELQLNEEVHIEKIIGGVGQFDPGVIQYSFTYFNRYGQETNVFYTSPLFYTSFMDRAGNAEEKVTNAFKITVDNLDTNFDYVRIYCTQWTTRDQATVRKVMDVSIKEDAELIPEYITGSKSYLQQKDFTTIQVDLGDGSGLRDISSALTAMAYPGLSAQVLWYKIDTNRYPNIKLIVGKKEVFSNLPNTYIYVSASILTSSLYTVDGSISPGVIAIMAYEHKTITTAIPKTLEYIETVYPKGTSIHIIDTGLIGETEDANRLLYVGGFDITASTLDQKDNTLFLGNLKINIPSINNVMYDAVTSIVDKLHEFYGLDTQQPYNATTRARFTSSRRRVSASNNTKGDFYWQNLLNCKEILLDEGTALEERTLPSPLGFKYREYYRLGVQFQYKEGQWSMPVWLGDYRIETYPEDKRTLVIADNRNVLATNTSDWYTNIPTIETTIPSNIINKLVQNDYKKARAVIVSPDVNDRTILIQGVANPTMFRKVDRNGEHAQEDGLGFLYAQASWLWRTSSIAIIPQYNYELKDNKYITAVLNNIKYNKNEFMNTAHTAGIAQNHTIGRVFLDSTKVPPVTIKDYAGLKTFYEQNYTNDDKILDPKIKNNTRTEFDHNDKILYYKASTEIQGTYNEENQFNVDRNLITIHSPELILEEDSWLFDYYKADLEYVGGVHFDQTYGDINILTQTATISQNGTGFVHKPLKVGGEYNLISGLFYNDYMVGKTTDDGEPDGTITESSKTAPWVGQSFAMYWMVHLWNRKGSLNNDSTRDSDDGVKSAELLKKIISNYKCGQATQYFSIEKVNKWKVFTSKIYKSEQMESEMINGHSYYGNIEEILTPNQRYYLYCAGKPFGTGAGKESYQPAVGTADVDFSSIPYYRIEPMVVPYSQDGDTKKNLSKADWFAGVTQLILDTKINSYISLHDWWSGPGHTDLIQLVSDDAPLWIYTYPTENAIYNNSPGIWHSRLSQYADFKDPVLMKYRTTPHVVTQLEYNSELPDPEYNYYIDNNGILRYCGFLKDYWYMIDFNNYVAPTRNNEAYHSNLPLVELVREYDPKSIFGGTTNEALYNNVWIAAGEPVKLELNSDCKVKYSYGDTYYQKFECLKTAPFSEEDPNMLIDIAAFMVESRINIDGRWDDNRGKISNLTCRPRNFNLYNPVYSQENNYFTYKILDNRFDLNTFSNQLTWTLEKSAGAYVDNWTNITLANTWDLDGDKGPLNKIKYWQNTLYCFQDSSIADFKFNSRVQINTSDGTPIELANSGKAEGPTYLYDGIGCVNKWSITNTENALYFIDTFSKDLYAINPRAQSPSENLSRTKQMSSWFQENISNIEWNPYEYSEKAFADNTENKIYITTSKETLCYSENTQLFESLFDYQAVPMMGTIKNNFYSIYNSKLYQMFAGDYNIYYGEYKPWYIEFISNGNSEQQQRQEDSALRVDKLFSTLEYRMDIYDDTDLIHDKSFDYIQVHNEYQNTGIINLDNVKDRQTNLAKKFRIWRIQIPKQGRDRIRNPWTFIKLGMYSESELQTQNKYINTKYKIGNIVNTKTLEENDIYCATGRAVLHDMIVNLFI